MRGAGLWPATTAFEPACLGFRRHAATTGGMAGRRPAPQRLLIPPWLRQTDRSSLMPDFCSCGAQLPEDARFCHKCGKPQREEIVVEPPPAPPAAAAPPAPGDAAAWPRAPSFRHPLAWRVGFF